MECHNCRWNGEPPTDEKAAACHKCRLAPDYVNHHGKVFVSIDAAESNFKGGAVTGQTAAEVEASLQTMKADAETSADALPIPDCCRQTALALLDYMDGLTGQELKLLVAVAHGANLAELAANGELERDRGNGPITTRAGISQIWRGMLEKFPDLAGVLVTGHYWKATEARKRRDEARAERRKAVIWGRAERRADNATAKP